MKNNIGTEFMKKTRYPFLDEPDQALGVPQPALELPYDETRPLIIRYSILTGKTPAKERVEMAKKFNETDDEKVFLVSLKAGGNGLNLIGADVVIHLDPWWNVAAENQATDRAYRLGQTKAVQVIKLVSEDSIEQKVIELQERKKEIVNLVVADDDTNIQRLTQEDINYLLSE